MSSNNVLLFVPNIIGYIRVILMVTSFYFMPINHVVSSVCYIVSGALDAADGYAARYYQQSTKFGAILDQLIDRCGTTGLCIALGYFYPRYLFLFQLAIVIDISCHWLFFYSSLLQQKASHKNVDLSWHPLLQIYYSSKFALFMMCAGNEAFYASLYLLNFTRSPQLANISVFEVLCYITAPIALLKSFISLLHGYVAFKIIISIDVNERRELIKPD